MASGWSGRTRCFAPERDARWNTPGAPLYVDDDHVSVLGAQMIARFSNQYFLNAHVGYVELTLRRSVFMIKAGGCV
jgi:hypothetical protein